MKVYFIRHGQSQGNLEKRASGWFQSPLSELGHSQARALVPVLKEVKFDIIYSSDLVRAIQTAHDAIPGCKPVTSSLLREICVGSIAGRLRTDCINTYGDVYTNASKNHDYPDPGSGAPPTTPAPSPASGSRRRRVEKPETEPEPRRLIPGRDRAERPPQRQRTFPT